MSNIEILFHSAETPDGVIRSYLADFAAANNLADSFETGCYLGSGFHANIYVHGGVITQIHVREEYVPRLHEVIGLIPNGFILTEQADTLLLERGFKQRGASVTEYLPPSPLSAITDADVLYRLSAIAGRHAEPLYK